MNKPKDFIAITEGIRGFFAVHLTWNEEYGGFWEPEQSGVGSYSAKDDPELHAECQEWAEVEGIEFKPNE